MSVKSNYIDMSSSVSSIYFFINALVVFLEKKYLQLAIIEFDACSTVRNGTSHRNHNCTGNQLAENVEIRKSV